MKTSESHFWSYYFDFLAFPVMIILTIPIMITTDMSLRYLVWFTLGLAAWFLFEYLFHRWGFHWFIFVHEHHLHHIDPAGYIGVSSLITSTLYLVGICLSLSLSMPVMAILQLGLSIGYLIYIFVHHQIHHGRYAGRYLNSARTRHNRHHHDPRCDFGVTVGFWDRIFGTRTVEH